MNTLLDKAKDNKKKSNAHQEITSEHIELAQAFLRCEIGITSVNQALGYPKNSVQGYVTICRALRHAHMHNNQKSHDK